MSSATLSALALFVVIGVSVIGSAYCVGRMFWMIWRDD